MKNKITLKEFFGSKEELAIHCDTEQKANKLLKEFDKLGKTWRSGESYLQYNHFDRHMDKTCYSNSGEYSDIEFYKDENYKIYSFEDIIFEEAKPKNLIPQIAKMLGVEIGEEFYLRENFENDANMSIYKFVEDGLKLNTNYGWQYCELLDELLAGKYTIQKLPKKHILTEDEKVILRNLPKQYKWITRDKYDELRMFNTKPFKVDFTMFWGCDVGGSLSLKAFGHLFQFIKWEDDNAYNIEELLKGSNNDK